MGKINLTLFNIKAKYVICHYFSLKLITDLTGVVVEMCNYSLEMMKLVMFPITWTEAVIYTIPFIYNLRMETLIFKIEEISRLA